MIRTSKLALCGVVVGALVMGASVARAQGQMKVDAALAKRGQFLFQSRGCTGCHAFGKKVSGPDLVGVTERRSMGWLKSWLKDPTAMYDTDSTAKQLLADAHGIKMPNLHLGDADIDALINYLAQENAKRK
jgi:cytochrome c551/c552